MDSSNYAVPQTQPAIPVSGRKSLRIGFPAATRGSQPFPLTPESASILVGWGYSVVVQKGAGEVIHYTDEAFSRRGVTLASRDEALAADIVVSLDALQPGEARVMSRGALLLTLMGGRQLNADTLKVFLQRHVHTIDLWMITDKAGHRPFTDILSEIEGRAAMTVAATMLSHPDHGKGIMLGGVTGVIPCEVVVLGSDIGARAAAQSALALGTMVRMLDNDPYGLRDARLTLGPGVVTSALQPHVLENSLRSADVVVASRLFDGSVLGSDVVEHMKTGVIVMDLTAGLYPAFPSLPCVAASDALRMQADGVWGGRLCYTAPGRTVPRTAAMALSNTLLDLLREICRRDDGLDPMTMTPGLRSATCTLRGKAVSAECARAVGQRPFDINLLLSCS